MNNRKATLIGSIALSLLLCVCGLTHFLSSPPGSVRLNFPTGNTNRGLDHLNMEVVGRDNPQRFEWSQVESTDYRSTLLTCEELVVPKKLSVISSWQKLTGYTHKNLLQQGGLREDDITGRRALHCLLMPSHSSAHCLRKKAY